MKKHIISPENRDDNDFFDAPRTKEILDLQDENAHRTAPPAKEQHLDLDDCNDRKKTKLF